MMLAIIFRALVPSTTVLRMMAKISILPTDTAVNATLANLRKHYEPYQEKALREFLERFDTVRHVDNWQGRLLTHDRPRSDKKAVVAKGTNQTIFGFGDKSVTLNPKFFPLKWSKNRGPSDFISLTASEQTALDELLSAVLTLSLNRTYDSFLETWKSGKHREGHNPVDLVDERISQAEKANQRYCPRCVKVYTGAKIVCLNCLIDPFGTTLRHVKLVTGIPTPPKDDEVEGGEIDIEDLVEEVIEVVAEGKIPKVPKLRKNDVDPSRRVPYIIAFPFDFDPGSFANAKRIIETLVKSLKRDERGVIVELLILSADGALYDLFF
jgi:hypothetical protein